MPYLRKDPLLAEVAAEAGPHISWITIAQLSNPGLIHGVPQVCPTYFRTVLLYIHTAYKIHP